MFTTAKEATMFQPKDYPCKCHVCGREFTHRTEFLSGTTWKTDHGTFVMVSCNVEPSLPAHSGEEIRAAWDALVR